MPSAPGPVPARTALWATKMTEKTRNRTNLLPPTLAALVAALALPGCHSDHRISLREFMERQQTAITSADEQVPPPPAELDRQLGPYKVGPGDVMTITLIGTQAAVIPPVTVRIDRKGTIDLPIVGALPVGDLELEDVEERIRQAYVPKVYADAVVHAELASAEPTNVLVIGAVSVPGLVQLRRTERNMLYAIVGAGGASDAASGEATLQRIRRPSEIATYDLRNPVQLAEALALEPLETGDIVTVHAAASNTVYVGGLVNRSAPQIHPPGANITALQALAGANGVRTDVFPKEGTLIRRMSDGSDVHVKLDLKRMARGEDPNIVLAAGDILWVPDTWETRVQDFVNRNIFFRAGVSVNYNVTGVEFLNRRELQGSSRGGAQSLQDSFDPLGFLNRNTSLQNLVNRPPP